MPVDQNSKKTADQAYHHGDLRNALVQAGLEILEHRGIKDLSLRRLARSAGVTHTAVYRHFRDREDVLAAIAEQGFRMLSERLKKQIAKHPADVPAQIRACGLEYVRFSRRYPRYVQLMFGTEIENPAGRDAYLEAGDETFNILRQLIESGQEQGLIRAGDPQIIGLHYWSLLFGFSTLIRNRRAQRIVKDNRGIGLTMEIIQSLAFDGMGR